MNRQRYYLLKFWTASTTIFWSFEQPALLSSEFWTASTTIFWSFEQSALLSSEVLNSQHYYLLKIWRANATIFWSFEQSALLSSEVLNSQRYYLLKFWTVSATIFCLKSQHYYLLKFWTISATIFWSFEQPALLSSEVLNSQRYYLLFIQFTLFTSSNKSIARTFWAKLKTFLEFLNCYFLNLKFRKWLALYTGRKDYVTKKRTCRSAF